MPPAIIAMTVLPLRPVEHHLRAFSDPFMYVAESISKRRGLEVSYIMTTAIAHCITMR